MVLLAVSNTEIILLVLSGLVLVAGIGIGILKYAKVKMESELDAIDAHSNREEIIDPVEEELYDPEEEEDDEYEYVYDDYKEEEEKEPEAREEPYREKESELEALLAKMQEDLEKQKKASVHTFEEEQEEKSIISYQELKAMTQNKNHEKEVARYEEEQEAFSAIQDPVVVPKHEAKIEKKEEAPKKTFSNSDFISPVYGKVDAGKFDYPKIPNFKEEFHYGHDDKEIMFDDVKVGLKAEQAKSFEDTFNLDPLSDDTKRNEEFLKALKEFRNNLE